MTDNHDLLTIVLTVEDIRSEWVPVESINRCFESGTRIAWSVDLGPKEPEVWEMKSVRQYFRKLITRLPKKFYKTCSNAGGAGGLFWTGVAFDLIDPSGELLVDRAIAIMSGLMTGKGVLS